MKKKIQFESNRAVVKEESIDLIDQVVFAMKEIDRVIERDGDRLGLEPLKFEIAGHTHTSKAKARSEGTMKLSLGRARAVMDELVRDGANRDHLTCRGYGGTKPISSTRPGKNRRVEIHVMNDEFGIDVSDSDSDEEEDLIFTDESEAPVRVGLVPCAIAGSKIRDWLSGDRNAENPMLNTLVNVQDAMKAGGVLKGILWHQGEEDCTPENAPRYGKDLETMVDQIRKAVGDPDLPFLVGQMSPEGINSREKQMVNDVHKNLPNRVPNCAFVNATDLQSADPRDVDHFSPDSYRELGERYADAYAHLLNHGPIRGVLSDRIARDNRLKPESGAQRGTLLDDMPDQLRAHRLLGDTHAPSHMDLLLPGASGAAQTEVIDMSQVNLLQ